MISFILGILLLVAPEVLNQTYLGIWLLVSGFIVMTVGIVKLSIKANE